MSVPIKAKPHIMFGKVMHARLFPRKNRFQYGIYYLSLPLSKLDELPIAYNRFGAISFYDKDHGACDGSSLEDWARAVLSEYGVTTANGEITLVCMPRILGYVFNPVSFWVCHDQAGDIRAVICEVHNTFGERHSYLCAHEDQSPITKGDVIEGQKLFHVSPFLEREGHYTFRFDIRDDRFAVLIDFYDSADEKQLVTSLIGEIQPMDNANIKRAMWRYPLVTMKAIALIHWQAVKLLFKGIKYIGKPKQIAQTLSATKNLKKSDPQE